MTVLKDLLFDLADRVRLLENREPTAEVSKRQHDWTARFHELEGDVTSGQAPVAIVNHDAEDEIEDDEPHQDPQPRVKSGSPRKKR